MTAPRPHTPSGFAMCRSGMSLLNLVIILMLIGALVVAGASLVGPLVKRGKINETKTTLNSNADAAMNWTQTNGRLPDSSSFAAMAVNRFDAWGKEIRYLYDANLALTSADSLCRATQTNLTVNTTSNVAFALISLGDDYTFDAGTSWSGSPAFSDATIYYPVSSSGTTATIANNDHFRIVTLAELQSRANCSGSTGGRLRIINNELPKACTGKPYTATLFADGGVPFPTADTYEWYVQNIPAGISVTPAGATSGYTRAAKLELSGTPGALGAITVYLRDNRSPQTVVQKTLGILMAASCGSFTPMVVVENVAPGVTVSADGTSVTLGNATNNTTGCLWAPTTSTLQNSTMRTFFNFRFAPADTSANSTTYGDGFTFTLMQGSNSPTTTCGTTGAGSNLGYLGIPGDSVAVEFDTYPSGTAYNDPTTSANHLAVVKQGTNIHNTVTSRMGTNPPCDGTDAGCYYTANRTWMEDAVLHNARVEVVNNTSCQWNGITGNTLVKTWIDCSGTSCSDLTANLATAPTASHCFTMPATMNNVIYGFTEATGAAVETITLSNFGILFSSSACNAFSGWSNTLPTVANCSAYSGTTTALGGALPFNWSLTSGALPSGLSFCTGNTSAACTLSGTPLAAPGSYSFTEQVTDSCSLGSQSTAQTVSLTVADACYAGGISVRNQSGATRYYRKNGAACTTWGTTAGASITILPSDTIEIYSNNSCTTSYCTPAAGYCDQKSQDSDGDCQTQMSTRSGTSCVFVNR